MNLRLLDSLATTEPLAEIFSDPFVLASMLRFEGALAWAHAHAGIIPETAALAIEAAALPEWFDPAALARDARTSGTVAIPLVEALTARVREIDPDSAKYVHWGATSQDVTDTALALCLAAARPILQSHHTRILATLRRLSDAHAGTVMLGRTLLQPAPPVTFGLKTAGWFAACTRAWTRVATGFDEATVLQFGGASGTLAALGSAGLDIAPELAHELKLTNPDAPWHAHRDRLAALVTACGIHVATLGKIARDLSLLMQFEVGEVSGPAGGSSTMPHKRNPADCAIAIAAATRVPGLVASFLSGMVQEHERGLGGGHAEAPTVAAIVQALGSSLEALDHVLEHLAVDGDRMRANIAATGGVVFAERAMMLLAPSIGRDVAHRLIADATDPSRRSAGSFAEALAAIPEVAAVLNPADLAQLDSPEDYLGVADVLRRRLLSTNSE